MGTWGRGPGVQEWVFVKQMRELWCLEWRCGLLEGCVNHVIFVKNQIAEVLGLQAM
jgi:hypothetical protein